LLQLVCLTLRQKFIRTKSPGFYAESNSDSLVLIAQGIQKLLALFLGQSEPGQSLCAVNTATATTARNVKFNDL
jgi:hypothetical protein